MTTALRNALDDYTRAARHMELVDAAITMLEGLNSREVRTAIRALQKGQQRQLKLLDTAAARLGAPYPGGLHDE